MTSLYVEDPGEESAKNLKMGKMSTHMVWNVEIGYKSCIVESNQIRLLLIQQFSHLPQ